MNEAEFFKIVDYILLKGAEATMNLTSDFKADFVDIFAKNEDEFEELKQWLHTHGKVVHSKPSGDTVRLDKPHSTPYGPLQYLKIRPFDPSKPFRGAPDFEVDYEKMKTEHPELKQIQSQLYEMLELKGDDVLVYFLKPTVSELFDEK
ncbi:MAG: hypothetical protein ABIA93_05905 [Candidatus Woesearchaeota archaeon]